MLCAAPPLDSVSSGFWMIAAAPPGKKQLFAVRRAVDQGLTTLAGAVRCVSGQRFDDSAGASMAMAVSRSVIGTPLVSTETVDVGDDPIVWSIADLRESLVNLPPPIA